MNPIDKPRQLTGWAFAMFTIGAAASGACYLTAGASLFFPLGSVLFAAILVPPLCLISPRPAHVVLFASSIALGISAVWMLTIRGWLPCMLILLSFVLALAAASYLLTRLRDQPVAAAAIVSTIALAWLTWPVWVSPWLPGHDVHWLVTLHPLFAVNSACRDLGIWTEQRVAYRLTNLAQDVPYQLPASVLPSVAFHAAIAAASLIVSRLAKTRRPDLPPQ
jgi:hypothetical protein